MADRSKAQEKLIRKLMDADSALRNGELEEARKRYQEALEMDPNSQPAQQGLQSAQKMEGEEKRVLDLIAQGDRLFKVGENRKAVDKYSEAWNVAGQAGVIRLIGDLEQKRSLAIDLVIWTERVERMLQDAQQKETREVARRELLEGLRELPRGDQFTALATQLGEALERLDEQMNDDEHLKAAEEAYRQADFEQAVFHLEQLSPEAASKSEARNLLEKSQRYVQRVEKFLAEPERLLEQKSYRGVIDSLEALEAMYRRTPGWRMIRLQAGSALVRQALRAGREAGSAGQYEEAQREFEKARQDVGEILKLFPEHEETRRLSAEAGDLLEIARYEQDALQAWKQGDLQKADQLLGQALGRLENAREQQREYLSVQTDVERLKRRLGVELEAQERDPRLLVQAQVHADKLEWREAESIYRQLSSSPLEDVRSSAEKGLELARRKMAEFEALLKSANAAKTNAKRVELLEQARVLWTGEPRPYGLLETALLNLAEEALPDEKRLQEAIGYITRVLDYNPNSKRGLALSQSLEGRSQIFATIEKANLDVQALEQDDLLDLEKFDAVIQTLKDLPEKAGNSGELHDLLKGRFAQFKEQRKQWAAYLKIYPQAKALTDSGEWGQAVEILEKALQAFGEDVPDVQAKRLADWQKLAGRLNKYKQELQQGWNALQKQYQKILESRDYAGFLEQVRQIEKLQNNASRELGVLPTGFSSEIASKTGRLKTNVEMIQNLPVESPQEALGLLNDLEWKGDVVLEKLRKELLSQLENEIPVLKGQVSQFLRQNDLESAQKALTQLGELQGKSVDKDVLKWRIELQKRQGLKKQLDLYEQSYADWIAKDKPIKALAELDKALQLLSSNLEDLLDEPMGSITKLLAYDTAIDSQGSLRTKENYEKAQTCVRELNEIANKDNFLASVADLAERRLALGRQLALQSAVESGVALSTYSGAYQAASELVKANSGDPKYIKQLADVGNKLIEQLKNSAETRITHAESALKRSDYITAINYMGELEEKFFAAYTIEFPELLDHQEIQELRAQAQELLRKAKEFDEIHEQIEPIFKEVERLLLTNDSEQAAKSLSSIPEREMSDGLRKRLETLTSQVHQRIVNQQKAALRKTILESNFKLAGVSNSEGVRALYDELSEARLGLSSDLWPAQDEVLEKFEIQFDRVNQIYNTFVQVENAERLAEQAKNEGRAAEAVNLLDKALSITQNVDLRARLETRRAAVSKAAEIENKLAQSLQDGDQALLERRYTDARREFERARQIGAKDVDQRIALAEVGAHIESVQNVEQDLDKALVTLEQVIRKLPPLQKVAGLELYATGLLEEATALRVQYQDQQKWLVEINSTLEDAEMELANGDPKKANAALTEKWKQIRQENIAGLIKTWQDSTILKDLRERIQISERLRKVYESSEGKIKIGDLIGAEEDAKAVLVNAPDKDPYTENLRSLVARIGRVSESEQALNAADTHARDGKFAEAREQYLLAVKLGANPDRVKQVQLGLSERMLDVARQKARANQFKEARQLLQDAQQGADAARYQKVFDDISSMESKWKRTMLEPIEKNRRSENYSQAYTALLKLEKNLAWPEFEEELDLVKKELLKDWAEHDYDEIKSGLSQGSKPKERQSAVNKLNKILEREIAPTDDILEKINDLISKQQDYILRAEFEAAQELEKQGKWDTAREKYESIYKRAYTLNPDLAWEVEQQIDNLKDQQANKASEKDEMRKNKLLQDARQWHLHPSSKEDFLQARKYYESIRAMDAFKDDLGIQNFLDDVNEDIRVYDDTQKSINKAVALIKQGKYDEAKDELSLPKPSKLLEVYYLNLRKVSSSLSSAKIDKKERNYEEAINHYREAQSVDGILDLSIGEIINSELEETSRNLTGLKLKAQQSVLDWLQEGDYQSAVSKVLDSNKETNLETQERLKSWLAEQLDKRYESAFEASKFKDAQGIAEALIKLYPENPEYSRRFQTLKTDIYEKYKDYVRSVKDCLENFDLVQARKSFGFIRNLVDQGYEVASSKEIDALWNQVETLSLQIEEMYDSLQRKEKFVAAENWTKSVEFLKKAQEAIGDHPEVIAARSDLQKRLYEQALDQYKNRNNFVRASELCQLGLDLDKSTEIAHLLNEIESERNKRLEEVMQKMARALTAWDTLLAETLLEQVRQLDSDGVRLNEISKSVSQMSGQAQVISMDMEKGWSILGQRTTDGRFARAKQAFSQILEYAPSFGEAALWQGYASRMEQAVIHVETSSFSQAVIAFHEAETTLIPLADVPITTILRNGSKDELLEKRSVAAYEANQLWTLANTLEKLYRRYKTEEERGSSQSALDSLDEAIALQDKILEMVRTPQPPTPSSEYRAKFKLSNARFFETPDKDEQQPPSDKEHKNKTDEDDTFDSDSGSQNKSDYEDSEDADTNSEERNFSNLSDTNNTEVDEAVYTPSVSMDLRQEMQIEDEVESETIEEPSSLDAVENVGQDLDDPIAETGDDQDDVVESRNDNIGTVIDESTDLEKTRPQARELPKNDNNIEAHPSHDDLMDLQKFFPAGDNDNES